MHFDSTTHRHYMSMYKLPILPFVFRQNDECTLHILVFLCRLSTKFTKKQTILPKKVLQNGTIH